MDPLVIQRRLRAEVTVTEELDAGLTPPSGSAAGTANMIHTAEGARDYGYQAALVAGVLLFGWCVPTLVEGLGPEWLTAGWVQVSFRRPIYSGAELDLRVERPPAGEARPARALASVLMTTEEGPCVEGRAGLGRAPWSTDLADLPRRAPDPVPAGGDKPPLTLETPPSDLLTLDATVGIETARAFGRSQPEALGVFSTDRPAVHPAILARQMISLLSHTYDYGRPSIHVSTQLENLGPVPAGQPLALSGRLADTYERRGHHYAVTDGVLYGAAPQPLARIRHTNIFRVARRPPT